MRKISQYICSRGVEVSGKIPLEDNIKLANEGLKGYDIIRLCPVRCLQRRHIARERRFLKGGLKV